MQLWTKEFAYTLLPAVAVMLALAVILHKTLGKKPLKVRMIPFQIITCILLALEVGKQVCSLINGYDLYHLPFHFCSLLLFVLPVMAFYKGKHRAVVFTVGGSVCTAITLLTLIYPSLIYSAQNILNYFKGYFDFHTVTFHNLAIFQTILLLALNLDEDFATKRMKQVVVFIVAYCAVGTLMSYLLQTNYNNLYSCNVPPLEALRVSLHGVLGYVPTQILYVLLVTLADVLFVLGAYGLYRLVGRRLSKMPVG